MGKHGPPAWGRRDCRFDHLVTAGVVKGYGTEMILSGIREWDRADDIRRGIYRCAKHRGITAEAGPARLVEAPAMGIRKVRGGYEVHYRIWSKRAGRKNHLARYGADRASWPYDPRRAATAEERESWANRDESGRPVIH